MHRTRARHAPLDLASEKCFSFAKCIFEIGAVQRLVDLVDLEEMLKNAPTLAIVAVHTDKEEPS